MSLTSQIIGVASFWRQESYKESETSEIVTCRVKCSQCGQQYIVRELRLGIRVIGGYSKYQIWKVKGTVTSKSTSKRLTVFVFAGH